LCRPRAPCCLHGWRTPTGASATARWCAWRRLQRAARRWAVTYRACALGAHASVCVCLCMPECACLLRAHTVLWPWHFIRSAAPACGRSNNRACMCVSQSVCPGWNGRTNMTAYGGAAHHAATLACHNAACACGTCVHVMLPRNHSDHSDGGCGWCPWRVGGEGWCSLLRLWVLPGMCVMLGCNWAAT